MVGHCVAGGVKTLLGLVLAIAAVRYLHLEPLDSWLDSIDYVSPVYSKLDGSVAPCPTADLSTVYHSTLNLIILRNSFIKRGVAVYNSRTLSAVTAIL